MKMGAYIAVAVMGLCLAGAVVLCRRKANSKGKAAGKEETEADIFRREWAAVLSLDARVFNGLYSGLQRVADSTAKKPEKILREWCQRTHYKWEDAPVDVLCRENILPLIDSAEGTEFAPWASMLLDAAVAAGITKETASKLVLTQETADCYVEWDGNDLYPEDEVEILTPAWYQHGKLLEQGHCRKQSS